MISFFNYCSSLVEQNVPSTDSSSMRTPLMKGFWDTEIISGTTIYYLPTPSLGPISLNFMLYIIIAIIVLFLLTREKRRSDEAIKRAVLIGFGAAFLLFTLRMDLNWIALMREDAKNLFNRPIKERLRYLDGNDFYEFIEFVRTSIPAGEHARDETDFQSEATKQIHAMAATTCSQRLLHQMAATSGSTTSQERHTTQRAAY